MILRSLLTALVVLLFTACSNEVTGQKGRNAPLKTNIDSVSYGIGADIGHNMKQSGLDSLNVDAMAMGIRDGLDSAERISAENVRALVQTYMLAVQKKVMEREQKEGEENLRKGEAWLAENGKKPGVITTASGLQYEVLQAGSGPKPTAEDVVKVNYRGTLLDGTEFDSSYKRGQPAMFGVGNVIAGWAEAIQLMPVGSRYKLFIPAGLAYGNSRGPGGDLPPNSTLLFEVELLEIVPNDQQGR